MTAVVVPDHVIHALSSNLYTIIKSVLKDIETDLNLDEGDLDSYIPEMYVVSDDNDLKKKHTCKVDKEEQCLAKVWSGEQCRKRRTTKAGNGSFCMIHY
jgi:hypothetical protein